MSGGTRLAAGDRRHPVGPAALVDKGQWRRTVRWMPFDSHPTSPVRESFHPSDTSAKARKRGLTSGELIETPAHAVTLSRAQRYACAWMPYSSA